MQFNSFNKFFRLHSMLLKSKYTPNEINNNNNNNSNSDFLDTGVSNFSESFSLVNDPIKVFLNNNNTIDLNDWSLHNMLKRDRLSAQFPSQKSRIKNKYSTLSNCKSLGNGLNKIGIQVDKIKI
jgi:hypothetical protein